MAILGQRLIPGALDRYLARHDWASQTTKQLPPGHPIKHRQDNIDGPLPGDRGAHGPFDARARSFSTKLWARTTLRWLPAAAVSALAGGAVFLGLRARARVG